MNITLDIKTVLTVGAIVASLGGFYYSTEHRLSAVEAGVERVESQVSDCRGDIRLIKKRMKRR